MNPIRARLYSARGDAALDLLPKYLKDEKPAMWDGKEGCINCSVAENRAIGEAVSKKVEDLQRETNFLEEMVYYQDTQGMPCCREAVSEYLQELLGVPFIDPNDVVIGAGCNAVLENLFVGICERGDSVLVPSPRYATFNFDLGCRVGVEILGNVHSLGGDGKGSEKASYYLTTEYLERQYEEAEKKPKVLLITNPHNPTGVCYPRDALEEVVKWADDKNMDVVSDEIYAGSVHGPSAAFTSLASICHDLYGGMKPNHHVVYALSKDFGLSGMRFGVLFSKARAMEAIKKLNDMCQVSSQTQALVRDMLKDGDWVKSFRDANNKRVRERYDRVIEALNVAGVKYLEADAGMFVWVDLREFLGGRSESELNARIVSHGIMMTPGESMDMKAPGFFRLVFTAPTDQEFDVVVERLKNIRDVKGAIEGV